MAQFNPLVSGMKMIKCIFSENILNQPNGQPENNSTPDAAMDLKLPAVNQ